MLDSRRHEQTGTGRPCFDGEFQDPEASAGPLSPPHHTLLWGVVLAAAATILLIGLFQLT
jgi:hypothetical protein